MACQDCVEHPTSHNRNNIAALVWGWAHPNITSSDSKPSQREAEFQKPCDTRETAAGFSCILNISTIYTEWNVNVVTYMSRNSFRGSSLGLMFSISLLPSLLSHIYMSEVSMAKYVQLIHTFHLRMPKHYKILSECHHSSVRPKVPRDVHHKECIITHSCTI